MADTWGTDADQEEFADYIDAVAADMPGRPLGGGEVLADGRMRRVELVEVPDDQHYEDQVRRDDQLSSEEDIFDEFAECDENDLEEQITSMLRVEEERLGNADHTSDDQKEGGETTEHLEWLGSQHDQESFADQTLTFLLMNGDDDQQQGGSEYDEDDVFEPKEDDLVNTDVDQDHKGSGSTNQNDQEDPKDAGG